MTHQHTIPLNQSARQRGVILIFSLIFLLVLTVLGVGVVGTNTSEEKMSRNFLDNLVALDAAEAALRDAEIRLTGYYTDPPTRFTGIPDSSCTNGLCDQTVAVMGKLVNGVYVYTVYDAFTMTASPAVALGGKVCGGSTAVTGAVTGSPLIVIAGVSQPVQPCYLIEMLPNLSMPGNSASAASYSWIYRITSVGGGRSATTQVTLQEEFIP